MAHVSNEYGFVCHRTGWHSVAASALGGVSQKAYDLAREAVSCNAGLDGNVGTSYKRGSNCAYTVVVIKSRITALIRSGCSYTTQCVPSGMHCIVSCGTYASISCTTLLSSLQVAARLPPLDEVIVVLALVLRFGYPRQTGIAQQSLIGLHPE
jgi:hypothetical protein